MAFHIKSLLCALLLALPLRQAGAQTLPTFSIDGGQPTIVTPQNVTPPQLPAVPPPSAVPAPLPLSAYTVPEFAFSGQTDIAAIIEGSIRSARSTVDVAVYGMTLPGVAQALVDAHNRGVRVRIIVNESHVYTSRPDPGVKLVIDRGLDVRTLSGVGRNGIMHNKLGIYDGNLVSAGSFNWVVTANEANSENAVFLKDKALVAGYQKYYDWMWGFSKKVSEGPPKPVRDYGPPPQDPNRSIFFRGVLLPAYSFSPGGDTGANIRNALDFAQDSADIAVFSFYDTGMAQAVINAHKRGVRVRVLVDRVQASQSEVGEMLVKAGVPFRWSKGFEGRGVMHNKFAVLDRRLLMTGSFNWSVNAQDNNFENMFYTASPSYVAGYSVQFDRLFKAADEPDMEDLERARAEFRCLSRGRD